MHAFTQTKHQKKGALILDVDTWESSTILKLLARCNKTLLNWEIEKRCQSFGKDLHAFTILAKAHCCLQ
eukprot:5009014-Karenia_brevis.AAC.1